MKILFLANNPAVTTDFCQRLAKEDISAVAASYNDLDIIIANNNASITLHSTGENLTAFDKIFVIGSPEPLVHICSAIACYCRNHHVEIIDDSFNNNSGKLYEMFRFWEVGVPIPATAFGNLEHLTTSLANFGGTAVLKATHGTKGKENYLVHSADELAAILADKNPLDYILQEFIPNNGDYRIIAFDFKAKLAIFRSSNSNDHRNNTSLGGTAKIVELTPELATLAERAATAMDIRFAGVDIITDQSSSANYILEINRTPQFVSGAFTDEKYQVLRDYLRQNS